MNASLNGIRVLDVTQVMAGPFCAMLLCDMGADVIKVEAPLGDSSRRMAGAEGSDSPAFNAVNRGKRGTVIDIKTEKGREIVTKLASTADVLIENYRPGVLARNGLGWDRLRVDNPALIYASISAYGQTGPRAQEGGFDLTVQAMSGIMSVTGEPGGPPVKCGVPLADFSAGLYAAYSVASALRAAEATGEGTHIDVPMLGATLGIAALQTSEYFGSGRDPLKLGSAHPRNAPYQAFAARDGYFGMAAGNDALWHKVCAVVDKPEWIDDARFASPTLRAEHQGELRAMLEAIFAEADSETWLTRFREAGVPCAPINSYSQVLDDPQVEHMGWVQPLDLPNGVSTRTFGSPVRFSGAGQAVRRAPPQLGEHTDEVLAELGRARAST